MFVIPDCKHALKGKTEDGPNNQLGSSENLFLHVANSETISQGVPVLNSANRC